MLLLFYLSNKMSSHQQLEFSFKNVDRSKYPLPSALQWLLGSQRSLTHFKYGCLCKSSFPFPLWTQPDLTSFCSLSFWLCSTHADPIARPAFAYPLMNKFIPLPGSPFLCPAQLTPSCPFFLPLAKYWDSLTH